MELKSTRAILKTFTGQKIPVVGKCNVQVQCNGSEKKLPLYVIQGNGPALFGRNWLKHLPLNWQDQYHWLEKTKFLKN